MFIPVVLFSMLSMCNNFRVQHCTNALSLQEYERKLQQLKAAKAAVDASALWFHRSRHVWV